MRSFAEMSGDVGMGACLSGRVVAGAGTMVIGADSAGA